ncbi:MAG: hypothetical protein QNK37_30065 [Acidobacteriota bacterium]|nr:hypothetical protein [Acidobacteriota bacterium]
MKRTLCFLSAALFLGMGIRPPAFSKPSNELCDWTEDKELVRFVADSQLTTYSNHRTVYFTIGEQNFLAIANVGADITITGGANQRVKQGATNQLFSPIFIWNGFTWAPYQEILTTGAISWTYFTIDRRHFLALAQTWNGETSLLPSKIFEWTGPESKFQPIQEIETEGAYNWTYFSIDGDHYLAIANFCINIPNGRNLSQAPFQTTASYCPDFKTESVIYKWNGEEFIAFQSFKSLGGTDWEFFSIDDDHYLALANFSGNHNRACIDSKVFKWRGGQFEWYQDIPTCGATDFAAFSMKGDHYLAVANWGNERTTKIDSIIYRWEEDIGGTFRFKEFQAVPSEGGHYWLPFKIGDTHYLQLANYNFLFQYLEPEREPDRQSYVRPQGLKRAEINNLEVNSGIYRWDQDGEEFIPFQWLATTGALPGAIFCIDGNVFLTISNHKNNTPGRGSYTKTPIFRAVLRDLEEER